MWHPSVYCLPFYFTTLEICYEQFCFISQDATSFTAVLKILILFYEKIVWFVFVSLFCYVFFFSCGKPTFWIATVSKVGKKEKKNWHVYSVKWSREHFSYENLLNTQMEMVVLAGLLLLLSFLGETEGIIRLDWLKYIGLIFLAKLKMDNRDLNLIRE